MNCIHPTFTNWSLRSLYRFHLLKFKFRVLCLVTMAKNTATADNYTIDWKLNKLNLYQHTHPTYIDFIPLKLNSGLYGYMNDKFYVSFHKFCYPAKCSFFNDYYNYFSCFMLLWSLLFIIVDFSHLLLKLFWQVYWLIMFCIPFTLTRSPFHRNQKHYETYVSQNILTAIYISLPKIFFAFFFKFIYSS